MAHSQNCHRRRRAKVRRIEIRTHLNRSFRHSVGLLPIESSLRQATTFMYLNETILRAETGITPRRPLLIALFQMWTFLLLTLNPRSLLKARNFLIQRSTRAWTSGRNYRRLIARLNLYGLLWSLPLLQYEFFAIFFFELCFMDYLLSAHYADYRVSMAVRDTLAYVSYFQRESSLSYVL